MISVENVQSTSSTELFRIQQGGALPSRGGVLEPSISMSLEGDLFFSRWNLIAVRPASAVNMWSLDCGGCLCDIPYYESVWCGLPSLVLLLRSPFCLAPMWSLERVWGLDFGVSSVESLCGVWVACVISLVMSPYDVDSLVWCCFCGAPCVQHPTCSPHCSLDCGLACVESLVMSHRCGPVINRTSPHQTSILKLDPQAWFWMYVRFPSCGVKRLNLTSS